jgi:hypothetical protein
MPARLTVNKVFGDLHEASDHSHWLIKGVYAYHDVKSLRVDLSLTLEKPLFASLLDGK